MAKEIDSEIFKALSLKPNNATIRTHGGSGFSKTFKIETNEENGDKKSYFVKTGGNKSGVMFEGWWPIPFIEFISGLRVSKVPSARL
jgi:protein-ribulosamine 3-kinase